MRDLVEYIARALVDDPSQVTVEEVPGQKTTVYKLKVASQDIGKVIGKDGRTARSIRAVLSAAAAKAHKRAVLEIVE
jgi:predicted RNA-binding protein YlqC (UPF0109 family)